MTAPKNANAAPANNVDEELEQPTSLPFERMNAQSSRAAKRGGTVHPLFPTMAGEPIPQVDWINVVRFEPGRGPVDCPRVFPAQELQSVEDLCMLFGGGVYELRGRVAGPMGGPGPITRTVRYTIEGESIPFTGQEAVERQQVAATAAAAAPAHADPFALVLAMMQESAREARSASQQQAQLQMQSQQTQMQMMLAMMTSMTQASSENMKALATIMGAAMGGNKGPDIGSMLAGFSQMNAAQMTALAQLMPKPDTSDPTERLGKLMALAKELGNKDENIGEVLTGAGNMFAGMAQMKQIADAENARQKAAQAQQQAAGGPPQGPPAPPQPPAHGPAPHANGSAYPGQPQGEAGSLDA